MKLKHEPAKSNPPKRPDPASLAPLLSNHTLVAHGFEDIEHAQANITRQGIAIGRMVVNEDRERATRVAVDLLNATMWFLFHLDALPGEAPPTLMGLTPAQIDCLYAIHKWFAKEKRFAPSFADLQKAMGYSSPSAVGRLLHKIEEQGYITMNGGSRSIALTDKGMKYKPQGD